MIKLPNPTDWLINPEILHLSVDELMNCFTVDDTHDVPYVAGYSEDGRTIYIDKDIPKGYMSKKKKVFVETDRYLVVHEGVEKILLMYFKVFNPHPHLYQLAHQIAFRIEEEAVEADGHYRDEYDAFMNKYIKKVRDLDITNIPEDLDLEPYEDEDDYELLAKIKAKQKEEE